MSDLTGQRFGRLVVKSKAGVKGHSVLWQCLCDCGVLCTKLRHHLTSEKDGCKSCGCLKEETKRKATTTCIRCKQELNTLTDFYAKGGKTRHNTCKKCLAPIHNQKKKDRDRNTRLQALQAYGGEKPACSCCNENILDFLAIDHIDGKGNQHRKLIGEGSGTLYRWLRDNGYPAGFQVLCNNCNYGKYRNNGVCPHKLL